MPKRQSLPQLTSTAEYGLRLFFSGCRNPLAVYDLRCTLAKHERIRVDNVAADVLPCVLLLAAIDDDLVDDYACLCQRCRDEFNAPAPGFWHPNGNVCASLAFDLIGREEIVDLLDLQYLPETYRALRVER